MSTSNLDAYGLSQKGLIREDVMNRIWDISRIPLPFTDIVGSDTSDNPYTEWTQDVLAAPNTANAVIDGADASGNDTVVGNRVGNHHQISQKVVKVSFRADVANKVGRAKELAYQMSRRQQELRRDVDAICLQNQASVAGTSSVAGKSGGLPSWLATTAYNGTAGGFNTGTKLTVARTASTAKALTETNVRNAVQNIYQQGGDPSILMSVPSVIRAFSQYCFTSSARIASVVNQERDRSEAATALGAINVFVTDFGTLTMTPNRLQQFHTNSANVTAGSFTVGASYIIVTVGTTDYTLIGASANTVGVQFTATGVGSGTGTASLAVADVFILDPQYLQISYLKGYRSDELAKTGLATNYLMSVDWTLKVLTEKAHGMIGDIDPTQAVTT